MRAIYIFTHQLCVAIDFNYPQRIYFTLAVIILLMLTNICTVLWQFQDNVRISTITFYLQNHPRYVDFDIMAVIIIVSLIISFCDSKQVTFKHIFIAY